ncbi:MAG: HAD family hydrolase [Sphingopyxis sp.]
MNRPLLISDCDEVLLHMVVPFGAWLDEAHHIHFDLDSGEFVDALRHKATGLVVEQTHVWPLLRAFFETEMHRQQPISGAVEAINTIAQHADIVVLTNLVDEERSARAAQLRAVGIDCPVYTNQGGKGALLASIIAEYRPSVAAFVDDLSHQHSSVAKHVPHVWRLHMVGEPRVAGNVGASPDAHARIDDWASALPWLLARLTSGVPAQHAQEEML